MCDTTTLLAIQRKTLPTAIARSPRFLPNDINYKLAMPLIMAIDLLLYKYLRHLGECFHINLLRSYQTVLMSKSSSSHLHQE